MTLHRTFVALGYVITVIDSVPVWLPAFAIVAVVIAWVTRGRDQFQDSAAEAARAPLPRRTAAPVIDTRPGTDETTRLQLEAIADLGVTHDRNTTKGGRR